MKPLKMMNLPPSKWFCLNDLKRPISFKEKIRQSSTLFVLPGFLEHRVMPLLIFRTTQNGVFNLS